jgi:molybdate transport system ATP-binding protein
MLTANFGKTLVGAPNGDAGSANSVEEHHKRTFKLHAELVVPPGVTVLFGASGSGKSLTLRSVAGLARPDYGSIKIDDDILFDSQRGIDLPIRARGVGYVFQNLALFPHLSAVENVEFPITNLRREERRTRALELLKKFRVEHTALRRPSNISGGEAQRVAIARALASNPRILLLDEPLSALDEEIKLEIIRDLKRMNRELRLPVIYVTHNRDEALALGERAYVYERGQIVAQGEPIEVLGNPVKASVARLTGVENIFDGIVIERSAGSGTMIVAIGEGADGGPQIEVPLGPTNAGERVTIAVRSGDILVATTRPEGLSARNVLPGVIEALDERGDETLARVISGVTWTASLTRQAVKALDLSVGKKVWIAFKTFSCRTFDGDG